MKSKPTVVLIDDDLDEVELFAEAIKTLTGKVTLHHFCDSGQGFRFVKEHGTSIDLIFLDLNMPVLSGKQILKMLRENKSTTKTPVVIYSTTIVERDIEETRELSVSHYLQKPPSFKLLCEELERLLLF